MIKKDLKKAQVHITSGYGGNIVCDVYVPVMKTGIDGKEYETTKTIARIDVRKLDEYIARRVRGGLFNFGTMGRKYQQIILK